MSTHVSPASPGFHFFSRAGGNWTPPGGATTSALDDAPIWQLDDRARPMACRLREHAVMPKTTLSRTLTVSSLLLSSLLVSLAAPGVASAAEATAEAAARPSYRLQILAADASAAALFLGGDGLESRGGAIGTAGDVLMATGGVTYLLGGPVIHAVHRNYGRAAISIGLRVVLPVVGANIGTALSSCDRTQTFANLCAVDDMAAGFLIGAAAAAAADTLLVAPAGVAESGGEAARPRARGLSPVPRIVAGPDRALFGLGGQF
jgi:hypothetical protein